MKSNKTSFPAKSYAGPFGWAKALGHSFWYASREQRQEDLACLAVLGALVVLFLY